MSPEGDILVINAGSSSIKAACFDHAVSRLCSGSVTEIGGQSQVVVNGTSRSLAVEDHGAALRALVGRFEAEGLALDRLGAVAHRVVHGGRDLVAPCRVTPEVEAAIEACVPLAPLHNPHNLAGLRAVRKFAPHLPQFASFDTAFHAGNPEVALRYALPPAEEARGLRRYGFHGISYAGLAASLPDRTGRSLPRRLLALHLGNGASLCAIRDGRSIATTMGYSPLEGLTMGTRTGSIDGNAVLRLAEVHGIPGATRILNRESGLKGLGGMSDMHALRAADTPEARFAIAHFCYWAARHAGSMIVALGGLDAVVFTGGIGEHDPGARAAIVEHLSWLGVTLDPGANAGNEASVGSPESAIPVWIVPADEERTIARDALTVMAAGG